MPFWLAIALYKRKSCRIKPPAWLAVDRLQGQHTATFPGLPFACSELLCWPEAMLDLYTISFNSIRNGDTSRQVHLRL